MGRREERVTEMKLISRRQKQPSHVHWQEVGAVPTSYRYSLEQTGARDTHLKPKPKPKKKISTFKNRKQKTLERILGKQYWRNNRINNIKGVK